MAARHPAGGGRLDLDLLRVAAPVHGHGPDFLWPSPTSPLTTIEDDLAQVQATDPGTVAAELTEHARRLDPRTVPAELYRALTGDPAATLDTLVAQQRLAWQALVAPIWDRMRGMLDADITTRLGGWPMVAWKDCSRTCTRGRGGTATRCASPVCAGGPSTCVAAAWFSCRRLSVGRSWESGSASPALVYPMLGVGRLWEPSTRPPAIARLLGAGRAFVLAETVIPSTTSGLAQRADLAPATVSQHLAILRDAGLVTAERRGREVLYRQTPLAAALLHATSGCG